MSAKVYVECCERMVPVHQSWRRWTGGSGWTLLCCEGYGCREEGVTA